MKLDKRFFLAALLSVGLAFGVAACGGDDKDDNGGNNGNQNGNENGGNGNEDESKCGNGVIDADADEICDIGEDKQRNTADDVMGNDLTCEMYANTSSADKDKTGWEGKPGCSNDCKALSKGGCISAEEREAQAGEGVNGILKCGSSLVVSSENESATANVSYTMGSTTPDSNVKAAIICTASNAKIDASVATTDFVTQGESGGVALSFELSSLVAGNYVCYVALKAGDKGAVVCPITEGTPVKASGAIADLSIAATVNYTVAAQEGVIAEWNDFSNSKLNEVIVADEGILAQAGSDTAASLKFVLVNAVMNQDVNVKQGNNAANKPNALQFGPNGGSSKPGFAHEKNLQADENSHFIISSKNMGGKTIKIVAKTGNRSGDNIAKFSVVAGETEIISEFSSAADYSEATSDAIPAGTTSLYLYPWFDACTDSSCGNINIDSIVIE